MVFICCVIAAAVLKIAAGVILPFTIAILLAFVMYPFVKFMDKRRVPRIISILLVIIIMVAGMYIIGIVLFTSGKMIVAHYPSYEQRINYIYNYIAELFDLPNDSALSIWQNLWDQVAIRTFVRSFTLSLSNFVLSFFSNAVIIILFMIFILLEASFFKEKLEAAFESRSQQIHKMGHDLMDQITRYLTAKFFISLANGIIFAVSFSFIGLEFAIVWGVLQFIMNFIPNIGSIVMGVAISLFAFVQFWPAPTPIILIIVVILGVNMLCNVFDPKIVGDHVGISPLIVLVSLVIWGYIWGFAGMILAVPMMVIIKIICENIPIMEPVSILLGTRKSILVRKAELETTEDGITAENRTS